MNPQTNFKIPARGPSRRQAILGALITVGGVAFGLPAWGEPREEISHSAESIHQEVVFKAAPERVYRALLDTKQFDQVIQLSGVMASMAPGGKATEINDSPGGDFVLFGGYLTGRQIELVPNVRIVQAWRAGSWKPGIYSIARFALEENGAGTKLIFDHTGFPKGTSEHLASGWKANYWKPLDKFLSVMITPAAEPTRFNF